MEWGVADSFRRRFRRFFIRDWIDVTYYAFGVFSLGVAVGCVIGDVVILASYGDPAPGFPAGRGFLQGVSWAGVVLFTSLGFLTAMGGWVLTVRPTMRALTRHRKSRTALPLS